MRFWRLMLVAFVGALVAITVLVAQAGAVPPPPGPSLQETLAPDPPYVRLDGTVDMTQVPDEILVAGSDGSIVGSATKEAVFGGPTDVPSGADPKTTIVISVQNLNGETIGYLIPDEGFVPAPPVGDWAQQQAYYVGEEAELLCQKVTGVSCPEP